MLLKPIKILVLWMSLSAAAAQEQQCMDDSDCENGQGRYCAIGGACVCYADSDCNEGFVCECPGFCSCPTECCSDNDCFDGKECDPDGSCTCPEGACCDQCCSDSDCDGEDLVCDTQFGFGFCTGTCTTECCSDNDCFDGRKCDPEGSCTCPEDTCCDQCCSNLDCEQHGEGLVCEGSCFCPTECCSDNYCFSENGEQECVDGSCQCTSECCEDTDCGGKKFDICIEGECTRTKPCAAVRPQLCRDTTCPEICGQLRFVTNNPIPSCEQDCLPCCIGGFDSSNPAALCSNPQCGKFLELANDLSLLGPDACQVLGCTAPPPCTTYCDYVCGFGYPGDDKCVETCLTCCKGEQKCGESGTVVPQCKKFNENYPNRCFSSHSTVDIKGKGETRMDQLQVGDAVLTSQGYSKVYSFGHLDRTGKTLYLQIQTTANDAPLEISEEHMLYVFDEAKQMQSIVPARDIKVGNLLISEPGTQVEVQSIRQVTRHGAYAPFTTTGDIVVNGVVASNYIAFPPAFHDHLSFKQQHWVQHAALQPIRTFCGVLGCENETYDKATGYSKPVLLWMLILHWAQKIDSSVFMSGFLYLFALPTLWLFLNMTHLVAALLGYYVWKKMTNMKVAAIIEKKPTKCTLLN